MLKQNMAQQNSAIATKDCL